MVSELVSVGLVVPVVDAAALGRAHLAIAGEASQDRTRALAVDLDLALKTGDPGAVARLREALGER